MGKGKVIVLIILIGLITVLIPSIMGSMNLFGSRANAEDATYSESDSGSGSGSGSTTTTGNSLLVLEIVPYVGMGEIGYLIGGQEPINAARMSKDTATGKLSFLGGAVTAYDSYYEQAIPASGSADSGYTLAYSYSDQNGYFTYVGHNNGGTYKKEANDSVYNYVGDGSGSYNATLGSEITDIYTGAYGANNYRNVNAYFVYGTSTGDALYSNSTAYAPCSVTKTTNNTGDYDFNSDTGAFVLNKGHGLYNVLFSRNISGTNRYYMKNDYTIVKNGTGNYSWNLSYVYVGATGGNYVHNPDKFSYSPSDPYNYTYKWVPYTGTWNKGNYSTEGTAETTDEKVWIRGQSISKTIEYSFHVTLVNHEWFKRLTLGLTSNQSKELNVRVVTITPQQLNEDANQHYLSEANIIYINANYGHNVAYIDLYENYNDVGVTLRNDQKFDYLKKNDKLNFAVNDLNWNSTIKLFNRIAGVKSDGSLGGYRAGVVFDDTYYQDAVAGNGDYRNYQENVTADFSWNSKGATVSNLAKLYIMVYQRDAAKFYSTFMSSTAPLHITQVSSTRNSTGTTGSFIRQGSTAAADSIEATFWNGNTFCPYCLDDSGNLITPNINTDEGKAIITKRIPNYNITATTTDLTSNVLVLNGMDIFTSKFIEPLSLPPDALAEAQIALGSSATSFGLFSYIYVVSDGGTGYGPGKDEPSGPSGPGENGTSGSNLRSYISILNIEPTADFSKSEIAIKKILDGNPIKITNMTSEQFNCSILDINTHYDMLYIGDGSGRFNINGTSTVFNTGSLNGSVFHTGDSVITSAGAKYYTGNDLTDEKVKELGQFLKAGYPIVLENSIYSLTKVNSGTKLYSFINSVKSKSLDNFMNADNYTASYVDFMKKLKAALDIIRPQIRILTPTLAAGAPVNYAYVDSTKNELRIEFAVIPNGVVADRSIYYGAHLYMDYNEDGIFSSNEELTVSSLDGTSATGFNESNSTIHRYDLPCRTGVFQWKVQVVKLIPNAGGGFTETEVRSEITGYAAAHGNKTIYALQITDNADTYSLEDEVKNTSSLMKRYAVDQMVSEYNIVFKTMTVSEFTALYSSEPYTTATAENTNKLAGYHLLILDNQSDAISDTFGALTNIKTEIGNGMGVIFTNGAVKYSNQSNYLEKPIFENQKTYSYLSYLANPSSNYYIYNFAAGGYTNVMLNNEIPYHTTLATKTNQSANCEYPYLIGDSIHIADTSYTEDVTLDYYLDSNITTNPPLIGWYCLSDAKASTYSGIYSTSPNDAKNNYYLFNRGSTYYSGIQFDKADVTGNDDEIKLFINTIIATYKSTNRIIKAAPVIAITSPLVHEHTIILEKSDVEGLSEVPVTFTITESSSNMKLAIDWGGAPRTTNIYRLESDGSETAITDFTNVANGTYIVKFTPDELKGEHTLSITAENNELKTTTLDTVIRYIADPPTVTIDNSNLVINVDKHEQYLYSDIDYASVNSESDYLNNQDDIRLEFTIGNTSNNVIVAITDATGAAISHVHSLIHAMDDSSTYNLGEKSVPAGSYYVNISSSIMAQVSNFDITITATDNSLSGSSTVTLLRRSLFQLD